MGQNEATKVLIEYQWGNGKTSRIIIEPIVLYFGKCPSNDTEQWYIQAYNHEIKEWYDFAMKYITKWEPIAIN